MTQCNIIIFTDLDGSLLDHNNYDFSPAKPLLLKLKQYGIPLIINSSKTKLEIEEIQQQMGIDTPYIIENGAAVVFNPEQTTNPFNVDQNTLEALDKNSIQTFALSREQLLFIANGIKEKYNFQYQGFNDMTVSQISELTNLSHDAAFAASQRAFSEPILWQDSQARLVVFKSLLAEHNIGLQQGGRFIHLSGPYSKGKAMQWLMKHWQFNHTTDKAVIGVGDSINDVSMLNNSDYAVVIKNNGKKLKVKGKFQTIFSSMSGTQGWVETLTPLLNQLMKLQGKSHG